MSWSTCFLGNTTVSSNVDYFELHQPAHTGRRRCVELEHGKRSGDGDEGLLPDFVLVMGRVGGDFVGNGCYAMPWPRMPKWMNLPA